MMALGFILPQFEKQIGKILWEMVHPAPAGPRAAF
jgi:hypothetical protein